MLNQNYQSIVTIHQYLTNIWPKIIDDRTQTLCRGKVFGSHVVTKINSFIWKAWSWKVSRKVGKFLAKLEKNPRDFSTALFSTTQIWTWRQDWDSVTEFHQYQSNIWPIKEWKGSKLYKFQHNLNSIWKWKSIQRQSY